MQRFETNHMLSTHDMPVLQYIPMERASEGLIASVDV
jgi:hypothetical protein